MTVAEFGKQKISTTNRYLSGINTKASLKKSVYTSNKIRGLDMNKLAIIVPYREREEHLSLLIKSLGTFFKKIHPDIDYRIYVIEQSDNNLFNRGKLANIGFIMSRQWCDYICIHDVDRVPVVSNYSLTRYPTVISNLDENNSGLSGYKTKIAITSDTKRLLSLDYFSGVTIIPKHHYEAINGYANTYWGWGEEDNDLRKRFFRSNIPLEGLVDSSYIHLEHDPNTTPITRERFKKFDVIDPSTDGLNTLTYNVVGEQNEGKYRLIQVDLTE